MTSTLSLGIAATGIVYTRATNSAVPLSSLFKTYNVTLSANAFDAEITDSDGSYLVGPDGTHYGYGQLTPDIPLSELSQTYLVPGSGSEATLIAFNADDDTNGNSLYSQPAVSVVLGSGVVQGFDYPLALDSTQISTIKSSGYQFVVRYYSTDGSETPLSSSELTNLENAGLEIAVVFENKSEAGVYSNGAADALAAIQQANSAGQSGGSAIYFAIDDNTTSTSTAQAYFQQVLSVFNNAVDNPKGYKVGVYGSGATLTAAESEGASFGWLNAASYSWQGTGTFSSWQIAQVAVDESNSIPYTNLDPNGELPADSLGKHQIVVGNAIFGVDIDVVKSGVNFGAFGTPVVASIGAGNISVGAGKSVTIASDLTLSNSNNDAISYYAFFDSVSGGGYFTVGTTVEAAGQWFYVTPGNLSSVNYVGGSTAGSETLFAAVYDGTAGAWSSNAAFTATTTAPVVASISAGSISVGAGKSVVLASDLTLSNSNSDAISYYAFFDSVSGGGYFTVGSTVEAAGQWFYVTPGNLGSVSYVGGSAAGSETLFTAVYDGTAGAWSSYAAFTATTTAPVVAGIGAGNISVGAGKPVTLASDLTLSNPNSDTIAYYAFFDSGVGGGHFTVGGSIESAGQWFYVTPGNLSGVSYVGGSVAGSETLFAAVYDSTAGAWSSYAPFTATTTAPVVAGIGAGSISVGAGTSVTIAADLTLSNPNSDAIPYYAFFDSGVGGGHFTVGGSVESAGQWFYVTPGNLSSVSYVGGAAAGSETLFAAVYDSTAAAWSSYAAFSATTTAPVVAGIGAWNFSVGVDDSVSIASDLTLSNPNGDAISYYGFFDSGAGGGHFTVGGSMESAGQWFYVTPGNLSSVSYVGGSAAGSETLFAAVYDGTAAAWSSYASFSATTASTITLNDAAMFSAGAVSAVNTFTGNGGTVTYYGPVTFDGFTLTNLDRTDFALEAINAGFAATNGYFFDGSQALEVPAGGSSPTADTIQIQQQNGGLFSANSIELDSLSASSGQSVTFTGIKADNSTVTQTFNLDSVQGFQTFQFGSSFTGIKDLDLAPSGNVYFDNIVLAPSAGGGAQAANQSNSAPQITIANGAIAEISSAFSGNATFAGSTGTLELDNSSNFHGTVAGLTGQDTLDLRDMNPAAVGTPTFAGTSSGGTLTVTDGLHGANLALLGNYIGSTFVASSDGHGGTNIIDMAATAQGSPLAMSQHG